MKYGYYDRFVDKKTGSKYDVTPIFHNQHAFSNLIKDLSTLFEEEKFDVIIGLDAPGFIIGGAMAHRLKKGFVPVRKGGRLTRHQ